MPERQKNCERIVVIGGGLSGLTAAYRISMRAQKARRQVEVLLMEAKDRTGGAIWTDRVDGFTLEGGPDSFITNKPWAVNLCRDLGLSDQLIGTDPQHRRSFVVRGGRTHPVPEGFVLMAPNRLLPILTTPILSLRGKLRMLLDLVIPAREVEGDESLASFVKRRLGREALERLVQPLVGGIYTADPNELSVRATLPQFLAMERDHGGLIRGAFHQAKFAKGEEKSASGARYGMFVTLADGMDMLPKALVAGLPSGSVRTRTAVRRVTRNLPHSHWLVEPLDGPPIEADVVVLATEAHASARLLDSVDPDLALQLRAIPYASSAIVNIAYRRDQITHPLDGFGVVVPAIEKRAILAVSFLSVKFPHRAPSGTALMRVFLGGATQPEYFDRDDEALRTIVRAELYDLLGVSGAPLFAEVARHPRAMPQYTLGHTDRVQEIRRRASKLSHLILAGNAFDGVGIPDTIRAAELAAEAAFAALLSASSTAAA